MNAVAYVIAVLNPLLLNTRYVNLHLGPVHSLANNIHKIPNLPTDAFTDNRYHRHENKGIYVSKNLQDFIYNGVGARDEEGFYLSLDFESSKLDPPNNSGALAYFLHSPDFDDEEKEVVDQYIQTLHKKRQNSRSINKSES